LEILFKHLEVLPSIAPSQKTLEGYQSEIGSNPLEI
jgi:hypothetical protein